MFALIITIVSIALVAALAVATIYYGGDIFTGSKGRADATRVVTGGSQINGAIETFKATKGRVPTSLNELVTENFLKAIPAGEWVMDDDYIVATGLSEFQCKEANRQLGITGDVPSCDAEEIQGVTACCMTNDETTP